MATNAFASCIAPTAQDWEERRQEITQLYLNEDKPLKDVMASVSFRGFKVTGKMFKSRITKWGLDKNTKEPEARALLKMHAQRNGRPTKLRRRGQSVDLSKIEHYFKRKGISIENVLSSVSPSPLDMDIVCGTPSPAPLSPARPSTPLMAAATSPNPYAFNGHSGTVSKFIPQRIEAPDGLRTVERLFADVREYMLSLLYVDWKFNSLEKAVLYGLTRSYGFSDNILKFMIQLSIVLPLSERLPNRKWTSDVQVHAFILFLCTIKMINVQRPGPWPQSFHRTALATPAKDDHPTAIILAQILYSLRQLILKGEPLGLISRSLWNVTKDNLEYLADQHKEAGFGETPPSIHWTIGFLEAITIRLS